MAELAICTFGTITLAAFKRTYYTTVRTAILFICLGMICLYVDGAAIMYERLSLPLGVHTLFVGLGALFLDIGIGIAIWKNKFPQ